MTDNIADLVSRLNKHVNWLLNSRLVGHEITAVHAANAISEAAQALTRIAGELEQAQRLYQKNRAFLDAKITEFEAAEVERDRLRQALITIRDSFAPDSVVGARPDLGFPGFRGFKAVAREALGETP